MITWKQAINDILSQPAHDEVLYYFDEIEELPSYFKERLGTPAGQLNDFGVALKDGRGIHVKEYDDYYTIHWDKVDPSVSKLGHLYEDAPGILAAGIIGSFLGGIATYKLLKK